MNIYIAGPMRGYPQHNFPAFDEAKVRGTKLGHRIFNPADLDRAVGVSGDLSIPLPQNFCRECVMRDIASLFFCDAIALLPGWEQSTGACAEKALAEWLSLQILSAVTFQPL